MRLALLALRMRRVLRVLRLLRLLRLQLVRYARKIVSVGDGIDSAPHTLARSFALATAPLSFSHSASPCATPHPPHSLKNLNPRP